MARVYNFSAGPAVLPEEVLKEAADEMLDYKGCGMSVMEMSHRSKMFQQIIDEAEQDIRDLMGQRRDLLPPRQRYEGLCLYRHVGGSPGLQRHL